MSQAVIAQAESQQHNVEQAARDTGLYMNLEFFMF